MKPMNDDDKNNYDAFIKKISNNIKILRIDKGLTGEALSEKIHVSRTHLFKLENGRAPAITMKALFFLKKKYDVDLNVMFGGDQIGSLYKG